MRVWRVTQVLERCGAEKENVVEARASGIYEHAADITFRCGRPTKALYTRLWAESREGRGQPSL